MAGASGTAGPPAGRSRRCRDPVGSGAPAGPDGGRPDWTLSGRV